MAREFFKNLPNTSTPLTAERLNGLLDGEEAMGNLVVDSIKNKNLLSLTNLINNSTGRTSYSINGNNITITTLSSGTYRFVRKIIDNLEIGKTYTIHIAYWNDTNVDMLAQWGVTNPDGSSYYGNSPITLYQEQKLTFVPTETSVQFRVGYLSNSCTAGDILTVGEIQLEEGAEPTWFTPYDTYSNKALANEDVVVGSIRSKNMINEKDFYISEDIKYIPIQVEANTDYTLSTNSGSSSEANVFLTLTPSGASTNTNGAYLNRNITQNSGNNTTLYVGYRRNLTDYWVQLEKGSTATQYFPYQNLTNNKKYSVSYEMSATTGWKRIAALNEMANGTLVFNNNPSNGTAGQITIAYGKGFSFYYHKDYKIKTNDDLFTKFRIVYKGNDVGYLEIYQNVAAARLVNIGLASQSVNITLLDTETAGNIPSGYSATADYEFLA